MALNKENYKVKKSANTFNKSTKLIYERFNHFIKIKDKK